MKLLLLLLIVVVAIAAYLWHHRKKAVPDTLSPPSNRFHAVTIHARADACPEVRAFVAKKFLAKEAPRLPLDSCTAPRCQCSYDHYDDRRVEERRDEQDMTHFQGVQKRARKERRKAVS